MQGADGSQPAAGDSALSWLAPGQPAQPSRSAACLTMLLPAQHLTAEQGVHCCWSLSNFLSSATHTVLDDAGQAQLQAALEPWLAAPVTGHLSAAAAQQLLTGVSRLAGQALGGRSASRPGGPHSVTSDLLGQVSALPARATLLPAHVQEQLLPGGGACSALCYTPQSDSLTALCLAGAPDAGDGCQAPDGGPSEELAAARANCWPEAT